MIDPIAAGVATGYVTQKSIQQIDNITHPDQFTDNDKIVHLLTRILEALAPTPASAIEQTLLLTPYPSEYILVDNFMERSHVCVFFFVATPVRFDGVYGGTYLKTAGPGWVQVDIPGRLSTTDSQSHLVIVSYRDDAIGASF
jgi:hypothetical protein